MRVRSRRPLGAVLAVTAVLGAACSSTHATPGTVPTTAPVPTSTTEAPVQYAPSPYAWDRSASPALTLGGGAGTTLAAVIAPSVGQSWTAAGTRIAASGVPTATVWTSPDGATWSASAITPASTPSSALAAAQYRGQTVVVGSVGAGANRQAAAWLSPGPGQPFSPARLPVSSGPSSISLVAYGALGLFATGTVDGRFALWSSTDGQRWGEQPDAEKTITSQPGARITSMVAEGDSVYAAGSVGTGGAQAAAVWTSSDGIHWHQVRTADDQFSGPGKRVIYSVAPLQRGLVAVGAVNQGTGWVPAAWVSPDGASWSPPSTDFPGSPATPADPAGGAAARSVSAVPTLAGSTSLVATGGGPAGQEAWTSTDGLHWSPVDLPAAAAAATGWRATIAAATIDTTVIADGDPGQAHLLARTASGWRQPSSDPAVFGPVQPTALPVSLQPSAGRLLMTVRVESDPQTIGPAAVAYASLASTDGVDWSPAGAATAGPATRPAAGALAVDLPGLWVAVGEPASGQPEGWISPDGRAWTAEGLLTAGGNPATSPGPGSSPTAEPAAGLAATVNGLCATPAAASSRSTSTTAAAGAPAETVAAVGSVLQAPGPASSSVQAQGHQAVAWYSSGGTGWKRAAVTPAAPAGAVETMTGCARTPGGLVAWGESSATDGTSEPALWRSSTGATWSRVDVSAFGPGQAEPLTDLAVGGADWLAVADPNPAAGPQPAGAATGPAASAPSAAGTGPAATVENGQVAVWLSADHGSTWQAIDTATPPWLGTQGSEVDLVTFAGATPVLAGSVDGRLAVWTGTAVPSPGPAG